MLISVQYADNDTLSAPFYTMMILIMIEHHRFHEFDERGINVKSNTGAFLRLNWVGSYKIKQNCDCS